MATSTVREQAEGGNVSAEVIISADSHVMEPHDLWQQRLPAGMRERAPLFPPPRVGEGFQHHPGGHDPAARIREMETDGVSAEVLYPTLGLSLFGEDDAGLQEACFQAYNDWLIDYCRPHPERLVGIPCISLYDAERGVRELERCANAGLKGALVWQVPHPDLPFHSAHYEPFWEAAEALHAPVSFHILTGHSYMKNPAARAGGPEHFRGSVNLKIADAANGLYDLIFYGILERHPQLNVVLVENEIGWLPFYLQQWDYYYNRFTKWGSEKVTPPIAEEPGFYFRRQVYATFFNDAVGARNLAWWGHYNCMWSNDFPHPNSTWPNSRKVIQRDLGGLPPDIRAKLVRENVSKLYDMKL